MSYTGKKGSVTTLELMKVLPHHDWVCYPSSNNHFMALEFLLHVSPSSYRRQRAFEKKDLPQTSGRGEFKVETFRGRRGTE